MGTQRIDARIPMELYQEIKRTKQRTSAVVCAALEAYLHTESAQQHTGYDRETITILQDQVADLQHQRDQLQIRVDYYTLPWYQKIFRNPLLQLPPGKPRP